MQNHDPRNNYVRAEAALTDLMQQIREADVQLGHDEHSQRQHERNVRELADLADWAETAADLADRDTATDRAAG